MGANAARLPLRFYNAVPDWPSAVGSPRVLNATGVIELTHPEIPESS